MKKENFTVLFYLNKTRINQKGTCPIFCRITYDKKRKQFATGYFVNPKEWNAKKQHVEGIDLTTNTQLSIMKQALDKCYLKLQVGEIELNAEAIYDSYFQKPFKKEDSVISYLNKDILKMSKLIGRDLKQATWNKFSYAYNDVASFIKFHFKKSDIPLGELNLNFLEEFQYYLKTEKGNKQVTINKTIQRFRKPIKTAISEGYLSVDPFLMYKSTRVRKEIIFLTEEELYKFERHSFTQSRLNLVKDLFVFCCYTGLPYNEMSNLTREEVVKGFDNMQWIQIKREKTSKPLSIPLLPMAESILMKYSGGNDLLPKISNQKFNSYLKEIAAIVGINKNLTHHVARKTFASTILLYNDVPMEIVSELLGHSNIVITQESYGKIVQKKISDAILKLGEKLANS